MNITKILIKNFKCYQEFELELNSGINIIVGNNEAGKSTIIEAIHLALSGLFDGKYIKYELTQYLFNKNAIEKYIKNPTELPIILIELYFEKDSFPLFEGNANSKKIPKENGISFQIKFDENYKSEYNELIKSGGMRTLPIEYYEIVWNTFARETITPRMIPIKSALIDSTSGKYKNGSDIYIARIIKENLEHEDIVGISQAHRNMRDTFNNDKYIEKINKKIKENTISNKDIKLSVELLSKNAWGNSLMTYLDEIPFHFIGKGEQCILKTSLALSHKKTKESNIILIEEPENHLSHTKLNQLIKQIKNHSTSKQILISTHSSFVANKLGLNSLILLNNRKALKLIELTKETKSFFEKISGYDTLRLLLCDKAILVEGDSDELVVQKAYMQENEGKLPIEDGIDVISVGISFKRFLEIAENIKLKVTVVTDNDGDIEALNKKYTNYLKNNKKENILISFDNTVDDGSLKIGDKSFNYNTLEPKILKVNNLEILNNIFSTAYKSNDDLLKYMNKNKTKCALDIFDTKEDIHFPEYILEAIK
jgi:putative ATP-dependent endonuclease of OLD family